MEWKFIKSKGMLKVAPQDLSDLENIKIVIRKTLDCDITNKSYLMHIDDTGKILYAYSDFYIPILEPDETYEYHSVEVAKCIIAQLQDMQFLDLEDTYDHPKDSPLYEDDCNDFVVEFNSGDIHKIVCNYSRANNELASIEDFTDHLLSMLMKLE